MDIDTHVDGPNWWLTVHPWGGLPYDVDVDEETYYAICGTPPPRRCEALVAGSYRGQQCPNYCEPGEYTCRDHPHIGVAP